MLLCGAVYVAIDALLFAGTRPLAGTKQTSPPLRVRARPGNPPNNPKSGGCVADLDFPSRVVDRSHPLSLLSIFTPSPTILTHTRRFTVTRLHSFTMYSPTSLIASLILGTLASAIQVTSPSSSTLWSSGTSGQTVSWKAVNTDPDSFVIQLVNQVSKASRPMPS